MENVKTWSDCALVAASKGLRVNWLERYFYCPHCLEEVHAVHGEMTHCPYCNFDFFKKGNDNHE